MTSAGNIEPEIKQTLEMLGITYTWIVVDPDFADTENFCRKYDYPMEKSGNTILVASKLDVNKKVKELMEVSRLSFANAEETTHLTGMMIGGVTPIGLPDTLPVFIDSDVMTIDYVIIGGGSRSGKIQMNPQELLKLPNSKVVQGLSKT